MQLEEYKVTLDYIVIWWTEQNGMACKLDRAWMPKNMHRAWMFNSSDKKNFRSWFDC